MKKILMAWVTTALDHIAQGVVITQYSAIVYSFPATNKDQAARLTNRMRPGGSTNIVVVIPLHSPKITPTAAYTECTWTMPLHYSQVDQLSMYSAAELAKYRQPFEGKLTLLL